MRGIFWSTVAGLGFIIGLTIIFGSWYTIDQTQRGILLRNGAFVEVVPPGLHFKLPWVETVYKIDMQTHTRTYGKDEKTGASNMEAYSADQQPAKLRVSVTLHVAPDKVPEMYSRFGGDYEAAIGRLVAPHVFERTKVVFGQYTAAREWPATNNDGPGICGAICEPEIGGCGPSRANAAGTQFHHNNAPHKGIAMYQPKAKWIEEGDSFNLMWGHIKVGEVSMGGNGTWYAYFRHGRGSRDRDFESLKDFPAIDLAQKAVENALWRAAGDSVLPTAEDVKGILRVD